MPALPALEEEVAPLIASGEFFPAAYKVHDAVYRTIDIATEEWVRRSDPTDPAYLRLNELVDDGRKDLYGGTAAQKRIASAANQTVLISASFQRFLEDLSLEQEGEPITPDRMESMHAKSRRLAIPLTQLHLLETRYIREALGSETLPGGKVQVYTNRDYFTLADDMLQLKDTALVDKLKQYPGTFADERIGCPGAKYIPEIWGWLSDLSSQYSYPALGQSSSSRT